MALSGVVHPETGDSIVTSGMVASVELLGSECRITLQPKRRRDPMIGSVRRKVKEALVERFPELQVEVEVGEAAPAPEIKEHHGTNSVVNIIAIASGKGGVGKSTVTANLAVVLQKMGYRVGVLDADIYGPSVPKLFGVEGYQPVPDYHDGLDYILPIESCGVKVMSIGFFINPDDALLWRGPMAVSALKQLINQTWWEELDFLLVDMPPGTGDVHLSVVQEMKLSGAIIVSTPQQVAVADVVRGVEMFRTPQIEVPVLGIIENMAWFTPAELPNNRYYLFGHGGARDLATKESIPFLGEIPIVQSIMEHSDNGEPAAVKDETIAAYYRLVRTNVKTFRKLLTNPNNKCR